MNGLHTKLTLDQHRAHLGSVQMQLAAERRENQILRIVAGLSIAVAIVAVWALWHGGCR